MSKVGDRALASLLIAHGLINNGGVTHVIEVLSEDEVMAAIEGFRFFDLDAAAILLDEVRRGLSRERARTGDYDERLELEFDEQYSELIPDDAVLEARFRRHFESHPEDFSSI